MYTLHVFHKGDLYEIAMRGLTIIHISRYIDGSNRRVEIEWEDIHRDLKELIIQEVKDYNNAS